LKQEKFQGTWY